MVWVVVMYKILFLIREICEICQLITIDRTLSDNDDQVTGLQHDIL